jgi:hypothetical protein
MCRAAELTADPCSYVAFFKGSLLQLDYATDMRGEKSKVKKM